MATATSTKSETENEKDMLASWDRSQSKKSDHSTRLLRTVSSYEGTKKFKDGYRTNYDLRRIRNQLIGKRVKVKSEDALIGTKTATITEVYPKQVKAQYYGGRENEKLFTVGISLADLVLKGIVDCSAGYCRMGSNNRSVDEILEEIKEANKDG